MYCIKNVFFCFDGIQMELQEFPIPFLTQVLEGRQRRTEITKYSAMPTSSKYRFASANSSSSFSGLWEPWFLTLPLRVHLPALSLQHLLHRKALQPVTTCIIFCCSNDIVKGRPKVVKLVALLMSPTFDTSPQHLCESYPASCSE